MHKITVSNNVTDFSLIGANSSPNAMQSALVSAEIGSTCLALAPSCFMGCENLVSVRIPSGCIDFGDYAFANAKSLKCVTSLQDNGNKLATIGNHCFEGCDGLSSVYFSLGAPVSRDVKIGLCAFAGCDNLESATWRDWSYLGQKMFSGCKKLKTLSVSNNTNYVNPYALAEIPNIEKVTIPNKVWFISDGMFANCGQLSVIDIQDTATAASWLNMVGANAFSGCSSLTSVTLPSSINAISCLDKAMLSGSSVQKVYFNGLDDNVFVTDYSEKHEISNTTYVTSYSEWQAISQAAFNSRLPVVMFTNHYGLGSLEQGGCEYCQDLVGVLHSVEWRNYMRSRLLSAYFVYAAFDTSPSLYYALSKGNSYKNPFYDYYDWAASNYYAKAGAIIMKKDGTASTFTNSPYSMGVDGLISRCEAIIKQSDGTIGSITLNDGISKFCSPLSSVTFVSSQGHEFVCSSDVQIEYQPEVRVDRETVSDFRYGTWYYNAKELRAFADANNIPVFVEYSSAGCDPCVYFKKNVYNNQEFQQWVKDSPYLFCRIEIESYESFASPTLYPEPYYVDKVWAKEKYGDDPGYIPIMMWYWNKDSGSLVFDLSSYHFNPSSKGSNPPFSMQELMQMTDAKFQGYARDQQYNRYEISSLYSNGGKVIGKYCANIDEDSSGVAFPCATKKSVEEYVKTFDLSGYSVLQSISVGQVVPYSPYTYYVYDTVASQSYHVDRYGVIFKVELSSGQNVVSWIQETQNQYSDDRKEQEYECARWYNLSSSEEDCVTFDSIVKESENMDYRLVILKTSTDDSSCQQFEDDVKNSEIFKSFVALQTLVYFIEAKTEAKDFSTGIGGKLKSFYMEDFRQTQAIHFGDWNNSVPRLIVYQACASCSTDPNKPAIIKASELDISGKTAVQVIDMLTDALA